MSRTPCPHDTLGKIVTIVCHCHKIHDKNNLLEEGGLHRGGIHGFEGILVHCSGKDKGRAAPFVAVGTQGSVLVT